MMRDFVEENNAGLAYTANVSVTDAVMFDPKTDDPDDPDSWDILAADDFNKDMHGDCKFFCPCCLDNGHQVRLKNPSKPFLQPITFDLIDPQTDEPIVDPETDAIVTDVRRYKIPARYSLYPGEKHQCDLGMEQSNISRTIRENGGTVLNSDAGAYIVNLNIPAGQEPAGGRRARVPLSEMGNKFNHVSPGDAPDASNAPAKRRIHQSSSASKSPAKSHGIEGVSGIASLLDDTQFDQGARGGILLRNGNQEVLLSEMFHDNSLDLYRDVYKRTAQDRENPNANPNHLALFKFQPNGNRKFWTREEDGSMTVPSQPEQITDTHGRKMYVSTKINFQTEGAFEAFKAAYDEAETKDERSFLVYSEHGQVNLADFEAQRQNVDAGAKPHADVAVQATVFNAAQMMQWAPRSAQLSLNFDDVPSL